MIKMFPLELNGHLIANVTEIAVLYHGDNEPPMILSAGYDCAFCDRRPTFQVTETTVYAQDPCPYPNGITTTITLNVPSGKLLVTDDLSPVYDWSGKIFAGYNSVLGRAQAVEAMAAIGCAYGPAGNCNLGLYRTGPDKYIIASPSLDDDDKPSLPDSDRLASICTNLWAYSCADFEHWKSRGGDPTELDRDDTVVDVPPGTYRFIHHSGEDGFDPYAAGTVVFADVERIS